MLTLWRRHKATCPHRTDRYYRRCRCAVHVEGVVEGKYLRQSLKTRSWERGDTLRLEIENGNRPKKDIRIIDALKAFVQDCEARNLNVSTARKYRSLRTRLEEFAAKENLGHLSELGSGELRNYRERRNLAPRTAAKELERIRAFFNFCVENEWLPKNPAKSIKSPIVRDIPTLPLSDIEVGKIMQHAEFRTQVFFRLLLHSGLRIIDAAQLTPQKIIAGKVFLYTQKTGTPVLCPLPPDLLADIQKLPLTGGFYFAVQSVAPVSIAERYRQKLNQAAIKAGLGQKKVKGTPRGKNVVHPHRFRDTFAVRLLEKGVPLETVSILLGHTDIRTTQRSYAPWVKSLQDNLELAIQKTWEKPKLALVKK